MIYEVKYTFHDEESETDDVKIFEIDDLILFEKQPDNFKVLFQSISYDNIAEFDDAYAIVFSESGRVIISKK